MESDLKTVFKKLQEIYTSKEYNLLMQKRSQKTYLEVMRKQRSETIFTSMLAWIFSDPDFDKGDFESFAKSNSPHIKGSTLSSKLESPIIYLLRLLAIEAEDGQMDDDLRKEIITNEIVVKVVSAKTEVPVSLSKRKAPERIDLQLDCDLRNKISSRKSKLRIFLENKVDSDEHDEQCKHYYEYCSNKKDSNYYDVFVFLSIDKPQQLSCHKYIKITYQQLLDNILTLILMQGNYYPSTSVKYLQDFINTITSLKTNGKRQIAMDKETKELLCKFYENNREIIEQAVLTCSDSNELKEALMNSQRDRTKYVLKYNNAEKRALPKSKVALEAIKLLKEDGKKPKDIERIFTSCGAFWSQSQDKTGYTDEVDFGDDGKYWVHTQRYKGDTFKKLVDVLNKNGFECVEDNE